MKDERLAQFMSITGLEDEQSCRGLLEAYGGDCEAAASGYFDDAPSPAAMRFGGFGGDAPMAHRPPPRENEDEEDEDFESALERSKQAFELEEERLLARAVAMSMRAARQGDGTEEDAPLDLEEMYDPGLCAALEMSVQPAEDEGMGAWQAGRQGSGGGGPSGSRAAPIDADAAIDADAELAASLAGGDEDEAHEDEAHERHLRHPDGFEASYAQVLFFKTM